MLQIFTHYSNFFFKGLSAVGAALGKGRPAPMAQGYSKLDALAEGSRVIFDFHHEHLTSNSSWAELTGQRRMFLLALITDIEGGNIRAAPYVIGNPAPNLLDKGFGRWGSYWWNSLEVHIDGIDSFSRVAKSSWRPKRADLEMLRGIPETDVKRAFASIIFEENIPNDWGGERSDLFSSHVQIQDERVSTAFMFKGPAQFRPMTIAELGKNGDQIDRLFSEPADLFVVQHCHEITPAVRGMMRAYAQQFGRLSLYCVIDGFDTLRLLRAYGKCGL